METIRVGSASEAIRSSLVAAGLEFKGERSDIGQANMAVKDVIVNGNKVKYYPWGPNNRLCFELIKLLRSNTDMLNLLSTKVDFLIGGGIGLFTDEQDDKGEDKVKEVKSRKIKEWLRKQKVDALANGYYTSKVELANSFVNVEQKKSGEVLLQHLDPTTVRPVIPEDLGKVREFVVSAQWDSQAKKKAIVYPAFDSEKAISEQKPDTIIHHRPLQTGQFWFGHPEWSSLKPVIELANRIPEFHTNALDSEGLVGMVVRVAKPYFEDLKATYRKIDGTEYTIQELKEAFNAETNVFLFGKGKKKVITDVCGYDAAKGQLVKHIEFEPIKRNATDEQYIKLAAYCAWVMMNGSGGMGAVSGISDGKMNSGGGTEIRISAEYLQFYRTYRHREPFLAMLNEIYLPILRKEQGMLEDYAEADVYFGHRNILLQTLDVNKDGMKEMPDGETNEINARK